MATIKNTRTGKQSAMISLCAVQGTRDSIAKVGNPADIACTERTRFVVCTDAGVIIGFDAEPMIPTEFMSREHGFFSNDGLVLFDKIDRLHITTGEV